MHLKCSNITQNYTQGGPNKTAHCNFLAISSSFLSISFYSSINFWLWEIWNFYSSIYLFFCSSYWYRLLTYRYSADSFWRLGQKSALLSTDSIEGSIRAISLSITLMWSFSSSSSLTSLISVISVDFFFSSSIKEFLILVCYT